MDSQGNLTEFLSEKPSNEFMGRSVLEAMQQNNIEEYIISIDDHLDLLPANNFLATFPRWIYTGKTYQGESLPFKGNPSLILDQILDQVRDKYDFIVIDTPPSLSEQTTNALCASEYVVVMFECSTGVIRPFLILWTLLKEPETLGIEIPKSLESLRTMNDVRRNDAKAFNEMIEEDYPNDVFETVITRKAPIGRLALYGFNENTELKQALNQYKSFYKELIKRVKGE